jgi:hypothetical protein
VSSKRAKAKAGSNTEETRSVYYVQLARARFGLMVPGMGYDCFRNWEMLLMGSLGVIERGIGFDRTVRFGTMPYDTILYHTIPMLRS